jgi:hypothetical protein
MDVKRPGLRWAWAKCVKAMRKGGVLHALREVDHIKNPDLALASPQMATPTVPTQLVVATSPLFGVKFSNASNFCGLAAERFWGSASAGPFSFRLHPASHGYVQPMC